MTDGTGLSPPLLTVSLPCSPSPYCLPPENSKFALFGNRWAGGVFSVSRASAACEVNLLGLDTGGFGVGGVLSFPLLFVTVNGLSPQGGSGVLLMLVSESVLVTLYRLDDEVSSPQRLSGRLMMCKGRGTSISVAALMDPCRKMAFHLVE